MMWCIAGSEWIVLDGELRELRAGWACLFRPHEPQHTCYNQKDVHVLWVHFTGSGCEDLLRQCAIGGTPLFRVGTDAGIESIVAQTIEELNLKRQHWESICAALLRQALLLTGRHAAQQASQRQVSITMSEIVAHLHANYARSITVDELAAMAGMNRFALIRAFGEATSRSHGLRSGSPALPQTGSSWLQLPVRHRHGFNSHHVPQKLRYNGFGCAGGRS